jgi:hypothetical protein
VLKSSILSCLPRELTHDHLLQTSPSRVDPLYGHEYITRLRTRFITHIFVCPLAIPQPHLRSHTHAQSVKLPYIIAYAFHQMKSHQSINYCTKPTVPYLSRVFKWSFIHLSVHDGFESHVQWYSSNKSWGCSAGEVFVTRSEPGGERDV